MRHVATLAVARSSSFGRLCDPRRALAKQLGADCQPYVAVIDAQKSIVATFAGGGDRTTWETLVGRLDD